MAARTPRQGPGWPVLPSLWLERRAAPPAGLQGPRAAGSRGQTNKLLCHSVCGEPRRFWGPEIRATAGPAGPSAAVPLVSPSFPGCRAALRGQRVLEHGWGTPEHPQGPVASAISSREGVKCLQMDYLKRKDAQKEGEPAGTVRVAHPARCQAQGCPSACPWPVGFSF